jgi:protoheme IX farnesyltransferase
MVAASLALIPFGAGVVYTVAAPLLGSVFLVEAHRLHRRVRRGEPAKPLALFHASISYLTALFVAVAVSQFV